MKKNYYITTTLPYVNAKPHIGHALEFVRADVLARWKRTDNFDVFFNTGTDEHGQKIFDSALQKKISPQEYVDTNSNYFRILLRDLNISNTNFIRTTDLNHIETAQEFWKIVKENGYIYKKKYISKYCVGCELEKTDSELINDKCQDHPNQDIQSIDEENYFFKFSAFQEKLLSLYRQNTNFVIPEIRKNEIYSFVSRGLKDFSISRLKSKFSWGVSVPDDNDHVMYVWFDALTSYLSTLGWPKNKDNFEKYWVHGTPTQYCGQDNLRQQAAMWQAMLMAAEIQNSDKIIINGFVTGEGGIKMSKSIGNVIDPIILQKWYGQDAVRYYLLRHIHPFNGSPITYTSFHNAYIGNLVNGLGNLTARLMTLSQKHLDTVDLKLVEKNHIFEQYMNEFRFDLAMDFIWEKISLLDKEISVTEPFKKIKTDPITAKEEINNLVSRLFGVAESLEIFLPKTSSIIKDAIINNQNPEILFKRVDQIVIEDLLQ